MTLTIDAQRAEAQRRTVERLLEGINCDKKASVPGVHADDYVADAVTMSVSSGSVAEMIDFAGQWVDAVDDYRMTLGEFFTSGPNGGAFTWTLTGSLRSAADGRRRELSVRGVSILEFDDDNLIRRETVFSDLHAMLRQLDLPPLPMEPLFAAVGVRHG